MMRPVSYMTVSEYGLSEEVRDQQGRYTFFMSVSMFHNGIATFAGSGVSDTFDFKRLCGNKDEDVLYKDKVLADIWTGMTEDMGMFQDEDVELGLISLVCFETNYQQIAQPCLTYITQKYDTGIEATSYPINPKDKNVFFMGMSQSSCFDDKGEIAYIRDAHYPLSNEVAQRGISGFYLDMLEESASLEQLKQNFDVLRDAVTKKNPQDGLAQEQFDDIAEYLQGQGPRAHLIIF